jgi:outer membrane protein TolC
VLRATEREVAQVEALLKQARSTVPPLRVALEAQLNRLDVLMGAQPGTYAEELSKPGTIPGTPAIGDADQPLDVLRRRPICCPRVSVAITPNSSDAPALTL